MMRRTKGFTLIELLVVIAIIAMLVSILAPSLTKILAQAKHMQCQTNLDLLRKTMSVYAAQSTKRDFYPNKSNTQGQNQLAILSRFGYEMGLKGKSFVCPSTDDNQIVIDEDSQGTNADKGSYSYQTPQEARRVTGDTENDVIFIADKAEPNFMRSMNHNDGEFLMAASKGGTYKSMSSIDEADPEIIQNMGRLDNPIYKQDDAQPAKNFTLRDDSYLLEVDSAAG